MSPDDFERTLAAAMRAEAERTMPAGDGLARIRARTAGRPAARFAWLLRPALAGGTLALAVVAATVVGLQLTEDSATNVVEPPPPAVLSQPTTTPPPVESEPDPIDEPGAEPTVIVPPPVEGQTEPVDPPDPLDGPECPPPGCVGGGDPGLDFEVGTVTEPDDTRKTDGGVPEDTGGNYVAITAPFSGSVLGRTFSLEGQARVFEANVTIDVSQNGDVLQQEIATASAGAPEKGTWSQVLTLAPGDYRIDAYFLSPADGATKLASDTIWITVAGTPPGADGGTPGAPAPAPTAGPDAPDDAAADGAPGADPATEPDEAPAP